MGLDDLFLRFRRSATLQSMLIILGKDFTIKNKRLIQQLAMLLQNSFALLKYFKDFFMCFMVKLPNLGL
ncbi:MAG: hypothetical protein CVV06_15965 [Gammaproteobacteria bacterium HGW-Gammaproteobacteria-10]|nr:MAG: hypothetical protein CVV06_15965 [Gammaproteobacteria bacterium HGW-Gammaproteobacteria-10]